jgi:hypothetical protein
MGDQDDPVTQLVALARDLLWHVEANKVLPQEAIDRRRKALDALTPPEVKAGYEESENAAHDVQVWFNHA